MLTDTSLTFLTALLDAPGPSGFESAPARRWRGEAESFADEVRVDVNGNSFATLRAAVAGGPVMLAGHVDEIGLMVVHIDDQGYLWFEPIGGWDPQVFVVLEALRRIAAAPAGVPVIAVATAQEEIASSGGGGARTSATGLTPLAAIVVDVTHATDTPGVEKKKKHGDVTLGGGVVLARGSAINPAVFDLLVRVAEEEGIPFVVQAAARDTGTDADSIFTAHSGVATGLVSVPIRYMHSPNELVALEDLDRATVLLAAIVRRVTPDTDFVPRWPLTGHLPDDGGRRVADFGRRIPLERCEGICR